MSCIRILGCHIDVKSAQMCTKHERLFAVVITWVEPETLNRVKAIICAVTDGMAKCISAEIKSLVKDSSSNWCLLCKRK